MDELLDDAFTRKIPVIIHNSFGSPIPSTGVYVAYLSFAAGLIMTISGSIVGIILFVVGGLAATLRSGVILDTANKKMKQYTSYFFIKSGKWEGIDQYPFLTLFKANLSSTIYSRGNVGLDLTETVYDVFLLTKNHRQRVLIYSCPSKEKAIATADFLGKKLEKEVVIYNPQSSSRRRR